MCCTIYPYAYLFYIYSLYLLISFLSFAPPPSLSPLVVTSLFPVSESLFLFCYIYYFVLFFRFHISMISYSICLSLTYFPKQNTLQVHSYCCKWHNFILLFWLSTCIYIYVYMPSIHICVCVYIYMPGRLQSMGLQRVRHN